MRVLEWVAIPFEIGTMRPPTFCFSRLNGYSATVLVLVLACPFLQKKKKGNWNFDTDYVDSVESFDNEYHFSNIKNFSP